MIAMPTLETDYRATEARFGEDGLAPETPALRYVSRVMHLYGLCRNAACRRARACRASPKDCLSRYAPLVPEEAREGVKAMIDGQNAGLTFDAMYEEAAEEIDALDAWRTAVARALLPRG
jgi:hypothetical protein